MTDRDEPLEEEPEEEPGEDSDEDAEELEEPEEPERLTVSGRGAATALLSPRFRDNEEWMLTYMDTVTLLLTLFVILIAFSTMDEKKYGQLTQGLDTAKYGASAILGPLISAPPSPHPTASASAPLPQPKTAPKPAPEPKAQPSPKPSPEDALAALRKRIGESEAGHRVKLSGGRNTIELEINERLLFPVASAVITDEGAGLIREIVPLLANQEFDIAVEGHTDSTPISTEQFPSNWELSAGRAASVARELITGGIERTRIRVVGYADTKPAASNETPEGRRANRRVTVVIRKSSASE